MTQDVHLSSQQLLTFTLAGQAFGLSVLQVNDILGPQKITCTPLSPPAVAGIMNLRGRIVTAIDMRRCLGQPDRQENEKSMSVVVEQKGELFSLMIDAIGDVLFLPADSFENVPVTLEQAWRNVATGIYKLDKKILIVLDVEKLLLTAQESKRSHH